MEDLEIGSASNVIPLDFVTFAITKSPLEISSCPLLLILLVEEY